MFILGLNGSPRKNGNTEYLLSLFFKEAQARGFKTHTVNAAIEKYEPCIGCGHCEKKGFCSIKDTMEQDLFPLFRKADVLVLASPVYFYSVPARIKAIIDRVQTLWARKYRFNLMDPRENYRKGVLLSVGATKGKNLFDGIRLTAKYFFDGAGSDFTDELCYSRVDERGELQALPGVEDDIKQLADRVLTSLQSRKKIMFVCQENAGRSQMAASFARSLAGNKFDVLSAGSEPADKINPIAIEAMAEKGIDIAFNTPSSINEELDNKGLDIIINMGCGETCPVIPGCKVVNWELPDPAGKPLEEIRKIRDEIFKKVQDFLSTYLMF